MAFFLPPVIGHRGAAAHAPENTLEGFRKAAELGLGCVEFDVKLTADGVPIVIHDDLLDRTTSGQGPVAATPWASIAALDAGSWFGPAWQGVRVPTLEQVVLLLLELGLQANIEIKPCPGREVETSFAVIDLLRRLWPPGRGYPLLSSFRLESLEAARDLAPAIPRGLLLWEPGPDWAAQAAALQCLTVHPAERFLTAPVAGEIKAAGWGLVVYTVNDPLAARRLRAWGVDSIITDSPELVGPGA